MLVEFNIFKPVKEDTSGDVVDSLINSKEYIVVGETPDGNYVAHDVSGSMVVHLKGTKIDEHGLHIPKQDLIATNVYLTSDIPNEQLTVDILDRIQTINLIHRKEI